MFHGGLDTSLEKKLSQLVCSFSRLVDENDGLRLGLPQKQLEGSFVNPGFKGNVGYLAFHLDVDFLIMVQELFTISLLKAIMIMIKTSLTL